MNVTQIFIFHLLISCLTMGQSRYVNDPRDGDHYYEGSSYKIYDFNWRFTFQDLIQTLEKGSSARSVEEALEKLPAPLRSNYLVLYMSRSLQQASPENPRILMFTPRADLMIGFNGHPQQRGYNNLEVMHFNYLSNSFVFNEITFEKDIGFQVSENNPAKCLICHQSTSRKDINPRPNWEPYALWPGVVGSNDGSVSRSILERLPYSDDAKKFKEQDKPFLELQHNELKILTDFIKNKEFHSRYKYLTKIDYEEESALNTIRHPVAITEQLSYLNSKRVAKLITEHPLFEDIKESLYYSLRCSKLGFSSGALQWLSNASGRKLKEPDSESDSKMNTQSLSEVFELIFEPFGVDTSDWSMDFKTQGRMGFTDRFTAPSGVFGHFNKSFNIFTSDFRDRDCETLRKISISKMDALIARTQKSAVKIERLSSQELAKNVLKNCASCHSQAVEAPYIAFSSSDAELREVFLEKDKFGVMMADKIKFRTSDMAPIDQAMPANSLLKPEERRALIQFIDGLTSKD